MNKKAFSVMFSLIVCLAMTVPAFAAGEGALEQSNINIRDIAATQRGAKLFVNYCLSCHAASYMRYNRLAEDLGLNEEIVMENLVFADVKIGETMDIAMREDDGESWFGKAPPDLSLISRSRGADWLFTYLLTFYQDESGGWNNLTLPNAAMPHVMWQLQGIQKPVYATHDGHEVVDHLTLTEPGLQSPEEFKESVRDLVTFLDYLGEPAKVKRKNTGVWVLLFLALFALIAYALKAEYWRDVH
ncbi:MAG: cytochrome c1 [Gammaproteobacteria bacterium]|jgi:ubiquinol-cytochrome c reductase cytochrome c1 subunit|nr:cytochrome c1 [Gammaproteobacteria bacterium]